MSVKIDQMVDAIGRELITVQEYYDDEFREVVKTVADQTVDIIKDAGKYKDKTGMYRGSIEHTKVTTRRHKTTCHVWGGQYRYRLSHLLENGHALVRGGRTVGQAKAYPHFSVGERWLDNNFTRILKERLEK